MDAQNQKLELIQWLINLNDSKTIEKLVKLKARSVSETISIEQYNRELDQAENRIAAGNFFLDQDLDEDIEKW